MSRRLALVALVGACIGIVGVDAALMPPVYPDSTTTHYGMYSADIPSVQTVASGDIVQLHTVSGDPGNIPNTRYALPNGLQQIWTTQCGSPDGKLTNTMKDLKHCGAPGPHILTGPVFVKDAEPGDVLEVDVLSTELFVGWGWNALRKGKGALRGDKEFDKAETIVVPIDLDKKVAYPPWGGIINFTEGNGGSPFFGHMGVAPKPEDGEVPSHLPGYWGGNLDNKLLGPGSKLYLPVNVQGALFSAGDGHAVQGDGEFCVTALEVSLSGKFRLFVHHGDMANLTNPRAETPTHFITMAFNEDLDKAEKEALLDMIDWMGEKTGVKDKTALYRLASFSADMRVTQVVNERKGVHLTMPKEVISSIRDNPPGAKHRGADNKFINLDAGEEAAHDEL